jgi:hypothetical protein
VYFVDELARRLPFDIVVTSGQRSAVGQVNALWVKMELGEDLRKTYIDQTYAKKHMDFYAAGDKQGAIDYQAQYYANSKTDGHNNGLAIDLRTIGYSQEQIDEMIDAAQSIGVQQTLIETTPPHLHVVHNRAPKKKIIIPILLGAAAWILLQS